MLRYYAVATCIVLAIAIAATAWNARHALRVRVASTSLPGPAKPQDAVASSGGGGALTGDAPWALSALPDCLKQISEATGSVAFVRSKIPAGAATVATGSRLVYGPCTIFVGDGEAVVTRGSDRLRIPPKVTFYRAGPQLVLLYLNAGSGELRVYAASNR